jgi:predicted cupin superfamily sugar epimerase
VASAGRCEPGRAPADASRVERLRLGPLAQGQAPVQIIPAGEWQAARSTGAFTLAGCSVGPGFDFTDFELLADLPEEAARFRLRRPEVAELI